MVRADTGRTQTDTLGLLSRENVRVNLEQNLGIKVPDQVKLKQVGLGVVTAHGHLPGHKESGGGDWYTKLKLS